MTELYHLIRWTYLPYTQEEPKARAPTDLANITRTHPNHILLLIFVAHLKSKM